MSRNTKGNRNYDPWERDRAIVTVLLVSSKVSLEQASLPSFLIRVYFLFFETNVI